jgi:hypothetical protein
MRYAEKVLDLIREGDDRQEVADFVEAVLRMEDEEDTVTNFWVTYNKENELHVRASYGPFETVVKVPKKENRGKAPMKSS